MDNIDEVVEISDPFIIRNYAPSDEAYIMSTWLRDLRDADYSSMPNDLWFDAHRKYITRILSDRRVEVAVLAAADNPSEIIGYGVAIPNEVIFWIQIRRGKLRHQGLARRLLTHLQCGPQVMLAFQTVLGKIKLKNPYKGRDLRHVMTLQSPS